MTFAPTHVQPHFARELQVTILRHSLFWLAAANFVGVLLALLLVYPGFGAFLGDYGYGRWMALHLNWQLYGWCSLPAIGALLCYFLKPTAVALAQGRWALLAWSFALAVGGASWLHGETTGKLFLDWVAAPRLVLIFAMVFLWTVLVRSHVAKGGSARSRSLAGRAGESAVLLILAAVPAILFWASGRRVYPPIAPMTGGPTGLSLLGSTLVIVLIMGLLPRALRIHRIRPSSERWFWSAFAANCVLFLTLQGGSHSPDDWRQVTGLGTLLVWVPLVSIHLRHYGWQSGSRKWLVATLVWWAILVVSGFMTFLPGVLERLKFTHALVAHAHLAMAGLLTSLNMLILGNLDPSAHTAARVLFNPSTFAVWQASLALHLLALCMIAASEIRAPESVFEGGLSGLYWMRLIAGAMMAAVSLWWTCRVFAPASRPSPVASH